ncbi:MAG: hypothetical protein K6T78_02170 [Alicyclobacillus sp.]|nr:hypothetical protein [Alicyclobacillus sp.]
MTPAASLQRLQPDNVPHLLNLAEAVGWRLSPPRVETMVRHAVGFGHVADGRLISSTLCFLYGGALSFVGLVMVHPEWQRQGLGRAVLHHCLTEAGVRGDRAAGAAAEIGVPTALVSTDVGRPLYEASGFVTVAFLCRHVGRPSAGAVGRAQGRLRRTAVQIRPYHDTDLADLLQLDRTVVGGDRSRLYPGFLRSVQRAWVACDLGDGRLQGAAFATEFGREMLVVGPVLAESVEVAAQLVVRLAEGWGGLVRVDVPFEQAAFRKWLASALGLPEVHRSPVMLRGGTSLPGDRTRLFGIMDAALG